MRAFLETVIALFLILASWAVLAAGLVGLGSLVLRLVSAEPGPAWRSFWVGFAAAIAVLQVWHIVAPVDGRALAVLGGLSITGLAVSRPWREANLGGTSWRVVLMLAAVTVWLADRSLGPPVGDAGLYHLSAIRWASEHAVVPGLANLHVRLGFNNPSLLWTAVVDVGGLGTHVSISLLVVAVALRGLVGLVRLAAGSATHADIYWALLLAPAAAQAVTLHELRISTPDPDAAMALVAMAAGGEFVESTFRPTRNGAFAAVVLAVLAACLKLSAAPFAVLVAAIVVWRRQAPLAAVVMAGVALVVPWVVRGVIMTGYPLYPLAVGRLPVDWRMPEARVTWAADLVRTHFMPPVAWDLSKGGSWIRGWLLWQLTRSPELLLVPALTAVAMARLVRRHRVLWLVLPCAASLAFWFRTPAPRFAYGFVWIVAAVLGVAVVASEDHGGRSHGRVFVAAVVLALLPIAHRLAAWSVAGDWSRVRETLVLRPATGTGFEAAPEPDLTTFTTRSGLVVWVPRDGDQVWDAPLPATPEPLPGLALRRAPGLDGGFVLGP